MKLFYLIFFILFGACSSSPESVAPAVQDSAGQLAEQDQRKTILFFGDSITAGYGLETSQAFPALIQHKIDSLGLDWKAVNAGLSGETTAGGLRRLDWLLQQPVDILLIELGGNDGLRGVSPVETRNNLLAMIDAARSTKPDVRIILAGMQIPPNLGLEYTAAFKDVFSGVAAEREVVFIPFILEGVGGISSLNLPDGIHPNVEGHQIVAETVWKTLLPMLR